MQRAKREPGAVTAQNRTVSSCFSNRHPVVNPLGTRLIPPQVATFSEVEAHFRQRRISLRLSLKSRRKACASLLTSVQLRNPDQINPNVLGGLVRRAAIAVAP